MLGFAFHATRTLLRKEQCGVRPSGLLWKRPFRLSKHQKRRLRLRLKRVDDVVDTLRLALTNLPRQNSTATSSCGLPKSSSTGLLALDRWLATMPREREMPARDKYWVFDRKVRGFRKGVHKIPKWTRVSQRINPPGY